MITHLGRTQWARIVCAPQLGSANWDHSTEEGLPHMPGITDGTPGISRCLLNLTISVA